MVTQTPTTKKLLDPDSIARWRVGVGMTLTLAMPLFADEPSKEDHSFKSGLIADYRSGATRWSAIEAKPSLCLVNSSRHPRLAPGPFEVEWSGYIQIRQEEEIRWGVFLRGDVTLEIAGEPVLRASGTDPTIHQRSEKTIQREPGFYPVRIRYQSREGRSARVQLTWEGKNFACEPIPAWRFFHRSQQRSDALSHDEQAERGRTIAQTLGCAACHAPTLPRESEWGAGPSLAGSNQRMSREFIASWLANPRKHHPQSRMPRLFSDDETGRAERWLIAEFLGKGAEESPTTDDPRPGRVTFVRLGCFACHPLPDETVPRKHEEQDLPPRRQLMGLPQRFRVEDLVAFLLEPRERYPDGRMPRFPLTPQQAKDLAVYLRYWSRSSVEADKPPEETTVKRVLQRLHVTDPKEAARQLIEEKRCAACHPGLPVPPVGEMPLRDRKGGCLTGESGIRFEWEKDTLADLVCFLRSAEEEQHAAPFFVRQRRLERLGCLRCHQRDDPRPPPIEQWGAKLGGAFLQEVPYQRTPRLTQAHQKYRRSYLIQAVRDGVHGVRSERYTYRMPAFGPDAIELVRGLAEADGEGFDEAEEPEPAISDPTLGSVAGPILAGSQGYSCISCHPWNGKHLVAADPGAAGPDLTRTVDRIRRYWFDRFLDDPQRFHPATPMPAAFQYGEPAPLGQVLDGQSQRQKDALWAYFTAGNQAPPPRPSPSVPIEAPAPGTPPLAAVIPLHAEDGSVIESVSVLWPSADLLIYDLNQMASRQVRVGAAINRSVQGRLRRFHAAGRIAEIPLPPTIRFFADDQFIESPRRSFRKLEYLPDGARIEWQCSWQDQTLTIRETFQLQGRRLVHRLQAEEIPDRITLEIAGRRHVANEQRQINWHQHVALPPAESPPAWVENRLTPSDRHDGSLIRPGYRATAYPRPKLVSGEDRVMPVALAAHPRDDQVFVASLKTGEIFRVHDPESHSSNDVFERVGPTLFADALSMFCDESGLLVVHRRNLSRWRSEGRFLERVALIPHGVADSYDYAYGLARDRSGAWVYSLAPYAHHTLPGSGAALRLRVGRSEPEAFAFGFRNPLGWCAGPDGEIFCTDNQGEWVPANKLCHVVEGRYYGFPNPKQPEHVSKPAGRAAVFIPYSWAHSINGLAYDHSGGKFGPYAGQFFLAELMFGGAILRADVEKVNGEYQGVCFPFWGKGLLGPVSLAFDARGRLFVGGITEPGWMAQPDRGQLFRIDFIGKTPFEIRTIRIRPRGFRLEFTQPVDRTSASDPDSYRIEHFRYEITGAYGSPELDRTTQPITSAHLAEDGKTVELTLSGWATDRVYLIEAAGVRSADGQPLVHPQGAYTVNQIPRE